VIGSQSLPTRVQMSQVDAFQKQLAELINRVNTVIASTLPGVYKQLHENSIYPRVGEPITLVRPKETSPQR
jgi:hypothetical protein